MTPTAEQELAKLEGQIDDELLSLAVGIPDGAEFAEKLRWLAATTKERARPLCDRLQDEVRRRGPMDWQVLLGKWPGDETDEEIEEALKGLS